VCQPRANFGFDFGEVAEWFKAEVLKTSVGASLPWVRIPPSPPTCQFNARLSPFLRTCQYRLAEGRALDQLMRLSHPSQIAGKCIPLAEVPVNDGQKREPIAKKGKQQKYQPLGTSHDQLSLGRDLAQSADRAVTDVIRPRYVG
jgi:hypothetical protein